LSILKNIKIAVLSTVKLSYLNKKGWLLVKKPQKSLSVKKFSTFYTTKLFVLYSKLHKLNSFLINNVKTFFSKKGVFKFVYLKNKNKFIVMKRIFIKEKGIEQKQIHLNVTFAKKNTFFNVSSPKGKTVHVTTVMRQGYLGKKRKSYTSIFSVALVINKLISNFYINKWCNICIIYKG
jgi:hypothetical protein